MELRIIAATVALCGLALPIHVLEAVLHREESLGKILHTDRAMCVWYTGRFITDAVLLIIILVLGRSAASAKDTFPGRAQGIVVDAFTTLSITVSIGQEVSLPYDSYMPSC